MMFQMFPIKDLQFFGDIFLILLTIFLIRFLWFLEECMRNCLKYKNISLDDLEKSRVYRELGNAAYKLQLKVQYQNSVAPDELDEILDV